MERESLQVSTQQCCTVVKLCPMHSSRHNFSVNGRCWPSMEWNISMVCLGYEGRGFFSAENKPGGFTLALANIYTPSYNEGNTVVEK